MSCVWCQKALHAEVSDKLILRRYDESKRLCRVYPGNEYKRRLNLRAVIESVSHETRRDPTIKILALNHFEEPVLGLRYLFSIFGLDCGVLLDCWASEEFLHALIPRTGSSSTNYPTILCRRGLLPKLLHENFVNSLNPINSNCKSPRT